MYKIIAILILSLSIFSCEFNKSESFKAEKNMSTFSYDSIKNKSLKTNHKKITFSYDSIKNESLKVKKNKIAEQKVEKKANHVAEIKKDGIDIRIFNKWKLYELRDFKFDKENAPYFTINKKSKRISGYSSCNSFGGQAILVGNKFKFGPLMMTKRYCGHDSVEHRFMSAFNRTQSYYIRDKKLVLLDGLGHELMKFIIME